MRGYAREYMPRFFNDAASAVSADLPDHAAYRDFALGIEKMREHVALNLPELQAGGLAVLDIGPGVGLFSVVAQDLGNYCVGVDAKPDGPTVRAYAAVTEAMGLDVRYVDVLSFVGGKRIWEFGLVDVVHARGSLDAVFAGDFRDGTIGDRVPSFLRLLWNKMPKGGIAWFGHNADPVSAAIVEAIGRDHRGFEILRNDNAVTKLVSR